jgi:hypothetical protein
MTKLFTQPNKYLKDLVKRCQSLVTVTVKFQK